MEPPRPQLPRRGPAAPEVLTAGQSQPGPAGEPRRPRWAWRHRRLLLAVVLAVLTFGALVVYAWLAGPLPKEAAQAQTTELTTYDGQPLAQLSGGQDRTDVRLDRVPRVVVDAVVATEDRHFFTHGGLDPLGIVRALFADLRGRALQGGSTITQQYVKNVYLGQRRTLGRKVREAVLSLRLERRYSKREILERYLNTIYFGRGAYGVEAASRAYFGVDVERLDLNQAAFLAGIITAPAAGDPYRNPTFARARRDVALTDMVKTHTLDRASADAARRVPLDSFVIPPSPQLGPTVQLHVPGVEYFVAYVTSELIRRFGEATALGGGLRVRTSLDPAMEAAAYTAVYDAHDGVLPSTQDPSGAVVAIDTSGAVRVMVGGRDFATSKVNLAVGAEGGGTGRQAGSTFKPMLLAEVVNDGYSLLSSFPAPAEIIVPHADGGADYRVKNFGGESFPGTITLLKATEQSVNTVFAQAVESIGPQRLVRMAHNLGVSTPLPANVSLVLGTTEVSPLEMAGAYSTLMNRGLRRVPQTVLEVRDASGALLSRADPQPVQVVPTRTADQVTFALQQVVRSGTGTGAQIGRPLAGKTGTTESSSDAWFIGYTPQLTAAVWMGYRDSKQSMHDIHGVPNVTGATLPAEIFRRFMLRAMAEFPAVASFPPVSSLTGQTLTPPPVTLVTSTTTTSIPTTSTTGVVSTTSVPPTTSTARTGPTTVVPTTAAHRPPPTTAPASRGSP